MGKTVGTGSNAQTYSYIYNGDKLVEMTANGGTLRFTYDTNGHPTTVVHNNATYYYVTNLQGDVIAILNSTNNTPVVEYTYNAWGQVMSITGSMANTLGQQNPLRYRGYVYDTETALYYLQSRYYDPGMGRFLNADSLVSTGQGVLGNNMFAYCLDNPVNLTDREGTYGITMQGWVSTMWWLCVVDAGLPFGDLVFTAGILLYGVQAISNLNGFETPAISLDEENPSVYEYREHTKGARQSTKGKHQKGQTRKNRDNRGEKGDARRYYIGNKKKMKMFTMLLGDVFYDESTEIVEDSSTISTGLRGRSGNQSYTINLLY